MATYNIKVTVEYYYKVEADSREEAEAEGWKYEDYAHFATVEDIKVRELESDDDDEEDGE